MNSKGIFYRIYRKCCYIIRRKQVAASKYQYALNQAKRDEKIVVSMTSYPQRFRNIHWTLKSIMLQTMKPDKIIVWLDEHVTRDQYTKEMIDFEKYGVEYRPMPGDLKPHKKYIYAMQEYSDSLIITVDDDLIYSKDLIESLVKTHQKYPNEVCARRVHRIIRNDRGEIAPYNNWEGEYTLNKAPAHDLFATGVGGVLYPPHCVDRRTFDIDLIMKLSSRQDDVWLKFMEWLVGTKVVWAPCRIPMPQVIEESQETSLKSENVGQNRNDVYFCNVAKYFEKELAIMKKI